MVVTDSTAELSAEVVAQQGVVVVPLRVVVGAASHDDGVDPEAAPDRLAEALRAFVPVSTSRPSPAAFAQAYAGAAARGASAVVSVHLSARMSATHESALLAAREASLPVEVVDTGLVGPGTGYAALAAAAVAAAGGSAEEAATAARERAAGTASYFYVDTLEYLRRGGRVGSAAALVGSALSVKPLLGITDGVVGTLEKVRTSSRALARLEELAVAAAADRQVEVAVGHLANAAGAEQLAAHLVTRLGDRLAGGACTVGEVGAAIGAHVGPGLVGVVVAPAL